VNELLLKGEAADHAQEKDYLEMLNDVNARHKFFGALTNPSAGDHSEIVSVKNRIASMIKHEADELGFKDQLSKEELAALEEETYAEVATQSNFYFKINEDKVKKNLKVYDFKAPGNKYRHPNVILPHEHCDIQHYLDTKDLTQDKLMEIYAYYSLMIDMHIS
jgi:hypothetical protein